MARCSECHRDIKLSIDQITDSVICPYCNSGSFKVNRSSGYVFAFGLILYFVFAIVLGVIILGVDPSAMFVHAHFPAKEATFVSVFFFGGFFIWIKIWADIWSKKYAKFRR